MKHCNIICSHFLFSVVHLEINGIFNSGRFYHPLPFKEPSSVSPARDGFLSPEVLASSNFS